MTQTPPDPKHVVAQARTALDAGRAQDAMDLLSGLPASIRSAPEVQFQQARAAAALGQLDLARTGFEAALAAAPGEPSIWMELALFAHICGEAKAFTRRVRSAPLPPALVTMATAAASGMGARAQGTGAASKRDLADLTTRLKAGDMRGVETRALPLLQARAGAMVWGLVGQARSRAGAFPQAIDAFRRGLALEPYAVDLRLGLAQAYLRQGNRPAALAEGRRVAMLAPAWAEAQVSLARCALASGATELAQQAISRAEALAPRADTVLAVAAEVALASGRPVDAVAFASRRKADAPRRALLLGQAATAAKDTETALSAFSDGLKRTPEDAALKLARAQLLQSVGETTAAERDLREILARDPGHGLAARALAYGSKLGAEDPAVSGMQAALEAGQASPEDTRLLQYALGRIFERTDPPASFAHLRAANAATAEAFPYDARADDKDIDRITGPEWDALRGITPESACAARPIFVTGLPRSGTTLVEAILGAHSRVRMGGEIGVLTPILRGLSAKLADRTATADDLTEAGERYARDAEATTGGATPLPHLTDKSIHTFVHIGHVTRVLPKARIIVVRRDPRDTGLSIWRNHFQDGTHRYAASFEGIADHIAQFERTVAFWRQALPPDAFTEIRYETLLEQTEAEARRLLTFAGLPWEDAVLDFHRAADRVDTLSFTQVRQPIYTSSKGGWRAHAAEIAPLITALSVRGLLPDENGQA